MEHDYLGLPNDNRPKLLGSLVGTHLLHITEHNAEQCHDEYNNF